MDWLLDLVIGTVADPVMGAVCQGSVKYVNKELPFSSRPGDRPAPCLMEKPLELEMGTREWPVV